MFDKSTFKNKKVLVTGGGTGIGFSISKQLLELGAEVIIASRKEEKLVKAKEELDKIGTCHSHIVNIREASSIEDLIAFTKETFGELDILVNNAGGQFPSLVEDLSENGWKAVIDTNLNGTFLMSHLFGKAFFIPQKRGKITNIIVNIFRGFPGMAHTGAARAGVDNLTKSLAVEWSKYNINVNAIAPGLIMSTGFKQYPEEITKGIAAKIPIKRLGTTEEVAHLVNFINSPMADYITGETIYIDGGWHLYGDIFEI